MMYSTEEQKQLEAARARKAARAKTPLASQSGLSASSESERRQHAPLQPNRGFTLLK